MKTFVLVILLASHNGIGSGYSLSIAGYNDSDCREAREWYLKNARRDHWITDAYCIPGPLEEFVK